jgi:hypothetical protein
MDTLPSADLPPNPVALIRSIDPDRIRDRLDEMEAEREALLVLLRAAQAARRPSRRKAVPCA